MSTHTLTPFLARSRNAFILLSLSALARLRLHYAIENTERGTNDIGSLISWNVVLSFRVGEVQETTVLAVLGVALTVEWGYETEILVNHEWKSMITNWMTHRSV